MISPYYVRELENNVATMAVQVVGLQAQVSDLTAQLQEALAELAELSEPPATVDGPGTDSA